MDNDKYLEKLVNSLNGKDEKGAANLRKTRQTLINMFNGGKPKNINPLKDIPTPKVKLYGLEGFFKSIYFDTEEQLKEYLKCIPIRLLEFISTIEYFEELAGRTDVVRQTINGKSRLITALDKDAYGVYNEERSFHQGKFVWEVEYCANYLDGMYTIFEQKGIVLKDNVYQKNRDLNEKILRMYNDRNSINNK
jgi:hypothetical protein